MTRDDFIQKFKEALFIQINITPDTKLADIPEWDSLGVIVTAAILSQEFSKNVKSEDLVKFVTVNELLEIAGM